VRATTPAPSLGDWPVDGLERVDRCPACASAARSLRYGGVTDRPDMCAAGRWNVFLCGECASAFLDLHPTKETGRPRLLRRDEIEPVALRGSDRAGCGARALLADVRGRLRPERADVVVIIAQKR
jgi:hypothetical protein